MLRMPHRPRCQGSRREGELRKLCRTYRVATRFCVYVGAESLRAGIADLMDAAAEQFSEKGESAAGGGGY